MSLVNVPTSDGWTEACTLRCPGAVRLIVQVSNQAVLYELGRHEYPGGGIIWDGEHRPLQPAIASLERRADAIRFRSLVAGATAVVNADGVTPGHIPASG